MLGLGYNGEQDWFKVFQIGLWIAKSLYKNCKLVKIVKRLK